MSKTNFAASRLVNPPGATPHLTEEQVWKGLEIKARDPKQFIAVVVESCDIHEDSGDKLTRTVVFAGSEPMKEEIQSYKPSILYFDAPDAGIRITNVLSYDALDHLVLTFCFTGGVPGFPGDPASATAKELNAHAGSGVERTIARIRALVKEGVIKA